VSEANGLNHLLGLLISIGKLWVSVIHANGHVLQCGLIAPCPRTFFAADATMKLDEELSSIWTIIK